MSMSYTVNKPYRYRLTNPPKAILKARLDNIAIVPASMLPLTKTLKEKVNTLPKGGVFLCYAQENNRQRKILARVENTFVLRADACPTGQVVTSSPSQGWPTASGRLVRLLTTPWIVSVIP